MTTPILQRGDKVHIVVPDTGDGGAEIHRSLASLYATQGVAVICTSAVGNVGIFQIVAVFRNSIPVEDQ